MAIYAGKPPAEPVFDLQTAIADFYSECPPDMRDKIHILNPSRFRHGGEAASAVADHIASQLDLLGNPDEESQFKENLERLSGHFDSTRSVCQCYKHPVEGTYATMVVIPRPPEETPGTYFDNCHPVIANAMETIGAFDDPNMLHHWILDHEIGHALTANLHQDYFRAGAHKGLDKELLWENAADNYALSRHLDRFGWQSGFPQAWSHFRTFWGVLNNDSDHLTCDSMAHMRATRKTRHPATLQEHASLAFAVAAATPRTNMVSGLLQKTFKKIATNLKPATSLQNILNRVVERGWADHAGPGRELCRQFLDSAEVCLVPVHCTHRQLNNARLALNTTGRDSAL